MSRALPQLAVTHCLSGPDAPPSWGGEVGRPSTEILRARLPPAETAERIYYCGPPAFNDVVRELLELLGYQTEQTHEFA